MYETADQMLADYQATADWWTADGWTFVGIKVIPKQQTHYQHPLAPRTQAIIEFQAPNGNVYGYYSMKHFMCNVELLAFLGQVAKLSN